MELEIADFILGEAGREALAELAAAPESLSQAATLATVSRLRRRFTAEEAAGLLEVAQARLRAVQQRKFSRAAAMFFTRSGLEQSSGELISNYRADRFAATLDPGSRVADLGCGIGGDSLGLARHFQVTGVDLDPARLRFAGANAAVYGLETRFEPRPADITAFDPAPFRGVFFDPARRTAEGRRIFKVEDYSPPLSIIRNWLKTTPAVAVKIAPGVDYAELKDYDCEVEIISESGDVKEAVLWFGELRSRGPGAEVVRRRATLLPQGLSLVEQPDKAPVPTIEPLSYLYEPDGAVIRAGLVEELAGQLGAFKIDPEIAYLTAAEVRATPFARSYRVLESLPFSLKQLNRRLNELNIGRVTVKKRGSPIEPHELERSLKLKGDGLATVVLTRVKGRHSAIICESGA